MKKILIPTDFSECASNAASIGIAIAKRAKAEVHFLHIMNTPVEWLRLRKEQEKNFPETLHAIGHAKAELTKLEQKAKGDGLAVKTFLIFDSSNDGILSHLKEHGHDFVVMGSHGASGARELLIGSNAQKMIRYSPVPVLVIKNAATSFDFKKIVFVSAFTEEEEKVLNPIYDFLELTKAQLDLLYVNTPNEFEESVQINDRLNTFLTNCPKGSKTHIQDAFNVERGVLQFVRDNAVDLIIIATEGRKGLMHILSHSITESLANHAEVPILSINRNTMNN